MDSKINNNDFIELDYTGKVENEAIIFDTTNEKVAKDNGIYRQGMHYHGIIVCVGHSHVVKGLDEDLVGKEAGKEYTVNIPAEKAFGKKSGKLLQLIATQKFFKDNIQPVPGLQVNVDGNVGVIKTVTGGRTLVDFNHPLASRNVEYSYKINKIIHISYRRPAIN